MLARGAVRSILPLGECKSYVWIFARRSNRFAWLSTSLVSDSCQAARFLERAAEDACCRGDSIARPPVSVLQRTPNAKCGHKEDYVDEYRYISDSGQQSEDLGREYENRSYGQTRQNSENGLFEGRLAEQLGWSFNKQAP